MNPQPPRLLISIELLADRHRKPAARLGGFHVQQAEFNLLAIQTYNWMLDVICEPAGGEYV